MRTITITKDIYKFEELNKDAQAKATEYLMTEYFWSDDTIKTLETCVRSLGARLVDYNIDWCNFSYNTKLEIMTELNHDEIPKLLRDMHDLKLTGFCMEYDFYLGAIEYYKKTPKHQYDQKELIESGIWQLIKAGHFDYMSQFEFDYVKDHCDANQYEFDINGVLQ